MYEDRTYNAILAEAQGKIPDGIQKNEGSLVYNALSALAYEIERLYIEADFILEQTYAATADYEHLKLRAADRGMYPYEATSTRVKGEFDAPVPIGARFNPAVRRDRGRAERSGGGTVPDHVRGRARDGCDNRDLGPGAGR